MAPQRCKVPNSIVAVNHIEVIDHIDGLHNELAMSMAGDLNHLSPHADFSYLILFFILQFDLPMCGNEQVVILHQQMCNLKM